MTTSAPRPKTTYSHGEEPAGAALVAGSGVTAAAVIVKLAVTVTGGVELSTASSVALPACVLLDVKTVTETSPFEFVTPLVAESVQPEQPLRKKFTWSPLTAWPLLFKNLNSKTQWLPGFSLSQAAISCPVVAGGGYARTLVAVRTPMAPAARIVEMARAKRDPGPADTAFPPRDLLVRIAVSKVPHGVRGCEEDEPMPLPHRDNEAALILNHRNYVRASVQPAHA